MTTECGITVYLSTANLSLSKNGTKNVGEKLGLVNCFTVFCVIYFRDIYTAVYKPLYFIKTISIKLLPSMQVSKKINFVPCN